MAYERLSENPLDYHMCRYGQSRLLFRGPKKNLKKPYIAFLGGSDTFGKYLIDPFPSLVEAQTGVQAANFGAVNAGVDAFVKDPSILEICSRAKHTVVQVSGAHNMSNRFYSVHPRRNDRFLKASDLLQMIYPEIDFSQFSFTKHMLMTLKTESPERFEAVEKELQAAWMARMEHMLKRITGKTTLLLIRDRRRADTETDMLGHDPLFVTDEMIATLEPFVTKLVKVEATPEMVSEDKTGMAFNAMEISAVEEALDAGIHRLIADQICATL